MYVFLCKLWLLDFFEKDLKCGPGEHSRMAEWTLYVLISNQLHIAMLPLATVDFTCMHVIGPWATINISKCMHHHWPTFFPATRQGCSQGVLFSFTEALACQLHDRPNLGSQGSCMLC